MTSSKTSLTKGCDYLHGQHPHLHQPDEEQHHPIVLKVLDILRKHRLYLKVVYCIVTALGVDMGGSCDSARYYIG